MIKLEKGIPNMITLANAVCGLWGIALCNSGIIVPACLLLFLGAFLDALDGPIARKLNAQSQTGLHLDSLADAVTFCALPAFILNFLLAKSSPAWYTSLYLWGLPLAGLLLMGLFLCAGLYRLARFNSQESALHFRGLPTPAAGMIIASLPLASEYGLFVTREAIYLLADLVLNPILLLSLALGLPILMLSSIKVLKPDLGLIKANKIPWLVFALLTLASIWILGWASVPIIILIYVLGSGMLGRNINIPKLQTETI